MSMDTVEFRLAQIGVLYCTAQSPAVERAGRDFLAHEPKQARGEKLTSWGVVFNVVGITLKGQDRPAEAEICHRGAFEILDEYAGLSMLVGNKMLDVFIRDLYSPKSSDRKTMKR